MFKSEKNRKRDEKKMNDLETAGWMLHGRTSVKYVKMVLYTYFIETVVAVIMIVYV